MIHPILILVDFQSVAIKNPQLYGVGANFVGVAIGSKAILAGGGYGRVLSPNNFLLLSAYVSILDVSNSSWTFYPNGLSVARIGLSSAVIQNFVLFAGGEIKQDTDLIIHTNTVDFFNYNTNTFTVSNMLRNNRSNIASAVINDTIVIFAGGFNATEYKSYSVSSNPCTVSSVDFYNATSMLWSIYYPGLSVARAGISSVSNGEIAFFAGGFSNSISYVIENYSNVVDIYDSKTSNWSTYSLSAKRYMIASANIGNIFLFVGGIQGHIPSLISFNHSTTVDIYDHNLNEWSTSRMLSAPLSPSIAVLSCKAFVSAGFEINIYDSLKKTWQLMTTNFNAASFSVSLTINSFIIVFSGYVWTASDDIYYLNYFYKGETSFQSFINIIPICDSRSNGIILRNIF